jgi:hypothetical protein
MINRIIKGVLVLYSWKQTQITDIIIRIVKGVLDL